jgi:TDG/mug DNA glycosylase family protein
VILPDVLRDGLKVVFCGTAVSTRSAEVRAYYAGPGNAFWATVHQIGLTPRQLWPAEYAQLLQFGIGLTDLCKVSAGSDSDVGTGGFDIPRLEAKLDQYKPAWIAFNGKAAAKAALGPAVDYGAQPGRLGPARVFVLPSTSGAARGFWDVRYWHRLAETV